MKMDESYFKEKLSAYLDKSLSPEEMAMMDEYVKEHEEARRILEEYKKLNDLVEKHSGLGESDYWERSARKIEEAIGLEYDANVTDIRPKARTGFVWKITAVAASAALLIFIGVHQWEIIEQQRDEVVRPSMKKTEKVAPSPAESAAVAESTQVFDVQSSEESEAGEGAPTQAEVQPTPKVADEMGDLDKSVGIPTPPPAKEQGESKGTVVDASLSRQQGDLSKSITVAPAPAQAPAVSKETSPPDTIHIRGGRSGEANYVVPSETSPTMAADEETPAKGYANLSLLAEEAGDTAYVIPKELDNYQRDSLLTYFRAERELFMEKPSDIEPKLQQPSLMPGLTEKPKSGPKASASIQKPKTSLAPEDVKRMLTASYVVAMLSPDESERDQAFNYILLVAEDTTSVHQDLADEYLIEIQNLRIDQK